MPYKIKNDTIFLERYDGMFKNKKNKGFTLIELIAVLVILAIIALIVIPMVLRIINNAKRSANERSVDAFGRTIEYTYVLYALNNNGNFPEACNTEECYTNVYDELGNVISKTSEKVEYSGSRVTDCKVEIPSSECVRVSNCKVNGVRVDYTFDRCVHQ